MSDTTALVDDSDTGRRRGVRGFNNPHILIPIALVALVALVGILGFSGYYVYSSSVHLRAQERQIDNLSASVSSLITLFSQGTCTDSRKRQDGGCGLSIPDQLNLMSKQIESLQNITSTLEQQTQVGDDVPCTGIPTVCTQLKNLTSCCANTQSAVSTVSSCCSDTKSTCITGKNCACQANQTLSSVINQLNSLTTTENSILSASQNGTNCACNAANSLNLLLNETLTFDQLVNQDCTFSANGVGHTPSNNGSGRACGCGYDNGNGPLLNLVGSLNISYDPIPQVLGFNGYLFSSIYAIDDDTIYIFTSGNSRCNFPIGFPFSPPSNPLNSLPTFPSGFLVIDVSNPCRPTLNTTRYFVNPGGQVQSHAFVKNVRTPYFTGKLLVISVSPCRQPLVNLANPLGPCTFPNISGTYIWDVTDSRNPVMITPLFGDTQHTTFTSFCVPCAGFNYPTNIRAYTTKNGTRVYLLQQDLCAGVSNPPGHGRMDYWDITDPYHPLLIREGVNDQNDPPVGTINWLVTNKPVPYTGIDMMNMNTGIAWDVFDVGNRTHALIGLGGGGWTELDVTDPLQNFTVAAHYTWPLVDQYFSQYPPHGAAFGPKRNFDGTLYLAPHNHAGIVNAYTSFTQGPYSSQVTPRSTPESICTVCPNQLLSTIPGQKYCGVPIWGGYLCNASPVEPPPVSALPVLPSGLDYILVMTPGGAPVNPPYDPSDPIGDPACTIGEKLQNAGALGYKHVALAAGHFSFYPAVAPDLAGQSNTPGSPVNITIVNYGEVTKYNTFGLVPYNKTDWESVPYYLSCNVPSTIDCTVVNCFQPYKNITCYSNSPKCVANPSAVGCNNLSYLQCALNFANATGINTVTCSGSCVGACNTTTPNVTCSTPFTIGCTGNDPVVGQIGYQQCTTAGLFQDPGFMHLLVNDGYNLVEKAIYLPPDAATIPVLPFEGVANSPVFVPHMHRSKNLAIQPWGYGGHRVLCFGAGVFNLINGTLPAPYTGAASVASTSLTKTYFITEVGRVSNLDPGSWEVQNGNGAIFYPSKGANKAYYATLRMFAGNFTIYALPDYMCGN